VLCRFPHPSNVSPWECETAISPSHMIASWNVSVHRFLRAYVHTRLQLPSRPARRLGAFAVSAFWHGMHAGYYLFFAGLFAMVLVERLVRAAAVAARLPDRSTWPAAPRLACGVLQQWWTMATLTFFGAAFNRRGWSETLQVWVAVENYGFWLLALPGGGAALMLLLTKATESTGSKRKAP